MPTMLLNILKRVESPEEVEEEVAPQVLTVEVAAGGGEEPRGIYWQAWSVGLEVPTHHIFYKRFPSDLLNDEHDMRIKATAAERRSRYVDYLHEDESRHIETFPLIVGSKQVPLILRNGSRVPIHGLNVTRSNLCITISSGRRLLILRALY
jgi:hypothetical protein